MRVCVRWADVRGQHGCWDGSDTLGLIGGSGLGGRSRLHLEPLGFLEEEPQVGAPHAHVEEAEDLQQHTAPIGIRLIQIYNITDKAHVGEGVTPISKSKSIFIDI